MITEVPINLNCWHIKDREIKSSISYKKRPELTGMSPQRTFNNF